MSETVLIQRTGTKDMYADGVVLLDPTTGVPTSAITDTQLRASLVPVSQCKDSTGAAFNPDACAHTYAYTSGALTTDTATDGTSTWVKTYNYTNGALTGETKWVKQ